MKRYCLLFLVVSSFVVCHVQSQEMMDLSGKWDFSIGNIPRYEESVTLPNSMLTAGKGDDISVTTQWTASLYDSSFYFNPYMEKYRVAGQMKFPFFLTPNKHYIGNAWYRKNVSVPSSWRGNRVFLFLERPHIETTLYVNGREAGHQSSLSTPHEYDVTDYIRVGKRNEIAIRVYNGIENVCVGQDSHSVTDQTQGNWNGIVGRIELQSKPATVYRLQVRPHLADKTVDVLVNDTIFRLQMGDDCVAWDEFHPTVYHRTVTYRGMQIPVSFGMREISVRGSQILLNGHPVWMRGTVGNCCFPETGYPPTDVESWMMVFRKCKEYGLNHMRFHSYCPPDAAFTAADSCGIYLQVEGPSWPNHGVKLRRGQKIDEYLMEESRRIIDTYGHHPSFVMMAAGNEPAGDWVAYCNDWVKAMHDYDPSRLYCGASVGGGWAWDSGSEYHVKAGARGLDWERRPPQSFDDYHSQILFPRNYRDSVPNHSPIIAHEQGQWCAFPDLSEVSQYTGAYKARNFEIFADLLRENGMEHQARRFLNASGRLQTLCYKYEIERNLRTPDYAGFQLLSLNDYSGQGSALVGVLNVHWREKGYCTADDWRAFCSPMVPLARFPKFIYTNDETLCVPIELMNASSPLINEHFSYTITSANGETVLSSSFPVRDYPLGRNLEVGIVNWQMSSVTTAGKFTLTVSGERGVANKWDFWVYPSLVEMPQTDILITDTLDAHALRTLHEGGKVLLLAAGRIRLGADVRQTYLPVFWNTSWFKMRPPHTTGAVIDAEHPLFRHFPTDDWGNLNWWELLNHAQVMNFCDLPVSYSSPIQPIDTWHVSRRLGMVLEAQVLNGKLLMTTMDISRNLDHRIVARQMRASVLNYMQSPEFAPSLRLSVDDVLNFFRKSAPVVDMFTNDSPDELKPKIK
ncbi:MAG: beta-glucuronidase [Prevotella sp.]|nr:beta-glucuronidase [Candidatus Equicola faecalis]